MELLRTPRLLLRRWEESDLPAFFDLYSRDEVMRWLGSHPRRTLATLDEARERLGRWRARERDLDPPLGLGTTDRWFGLTSRQFLKTLTARDGDDSPAPARSDHREP
jgi:RimJ/RimL family protein N-acetyltransferase